MNSNVDKNKMKVMMIQMIYLFIDKYLYKIKKHCNNIYIIKNIVLLLSLLLYCLKNFEVKNG